MIAADLSGVTPDEPVPYDLVECQSCHFSPAAVAVTFGTWPTTTSFLVCVSCSQAALTVGIENRVPVSVG
jgi:protein-arginine kinase activator protein McsA